jgi:hypothetical protein
MHLKISLVKIMEADGRLTLRKYEEVHLSIVFRGHRGTWTTSIPRLSNIRSRI